jgi:hypothetical protein
MFAACTMPGTYIFTNTLSVSINGNSRRTVRVRKSIA